MGIYDRRHWEEDESLNHFHNFLFEIEDFKEAHLKVEASVKPYQHADTHFQRKNEAQQLNDLINSTRINIAVDDILEYELADQEGSKPESSYLI